MGERMLEGDALWLRVLESPVSGWSAFGVLAITVTMLIIRGKLIPKATVDDRMTTANTRGDEWKESCMQARDEARGYRELLNKFADSNRSVDYLFSELLPKPASPQKEVEGTS